jgi:hypothetical protein
MYPAPTECPVCHDELLVTGLECRNCATSLQGRFSQGRLAQLTPEQLHFVEVFIRGEGKLNRAQQELGLSYPTVRSRLEDVIRALGFEVRADRREDAGDKDDVLAKLARHEITAEEALGLL